MHQRGDVNHLRGTVLPGLGLPLATYLILSFTPDQTQDPLPDLCANVFANLFPLSGL